MAELMGSKKLQSFRGKLSPAQIADGMNAAQKNARRLADDAALLLENKRFPTAASVAVLAIEEAGKVSVLRAIALARTNEEVREEWKRYRWHLSKNGHWILPSLLASGARTLEDTRPVAESEADHNYLLDNLKQLGFYTDCIGKANWSVPDAVIDEALSSTLVQTAQILARDRQYGAREIELWIEHLQPVWKGSMDWMKKGLLNWSEAMTKEGLGDDMAQMDAFIYGPGISVTPSAIPESTNEK